MMSRKLCAGLVSAFVLASSSPAHAADESDEAQRLFDEAKELIASNNWADACPRLARSQQLDPRGTTLFRLAECYEHTGKLASALADYRRAAAAATAAGETKRADFATERAKHIEPSVPHLVIAVGQRPATIVADGEPLDESRWGTRLPVDAGEHVVTATAPGKQRYTVKIHTIDATTTVLTIPPLLDAPVAFNSPVAPPRSDASASAAAPPARPTDHVALRQWSLGFMGVGAVSAGVGTAFLLVGDDDPNKCTGGCAAGTGLVIGGTLLAVTGLAFLLASISDDGSRRTARMRPVAGMSF